MKLNLFTNRPTKKVWVGKIFVVMRITLFLILLSIGQLFAVDSYSQNTRINLKISNQSVKSVLAEIQGQSEFSFMFNSKIIDVERKVDIEVENVKITEVLGKLFASTDVAYTVVDRQIVLFSTNLLAEQQQSRKLTGKVSDNTGTTVPGASVIVQGTNLGVVTNADGVFTIVVPEDAKVLIVSFIGMKSQNVTIGSKTSFEIYLDADIIALDEVVAVGYGTQKRANVTGAISTIKVSETLGNIPTTNLSSLLAGKVAGINIQSYTGVPGISSNLSIRTNSSTNAPPALFVIDGVVRTKQAFDLLDANEVSEITLLKDAASAAIYGSQSSGGVVLVATKRGKSGKPVFNYKASYSMEERTQVPKLTSAVEGAYFTNYLHPQNADNFFYYWDQDEIDYIKTINNGYGADNLKDVWVNPTTEHHSISVSGGTDKVRYYAGGSFIKQGGFMENLGYSKYDLRANLSIDVTKNLTIFAQLASASSERNRVSWEESNDMNALYRKLLVWQPDWRMETSDGRPIDNGWLGNISEFSKGSSGYNTDKGQQIEMLLNAEYKVPFAKGLKLKVQYANTFNEMRNKTFLQKQNLYTIERKGAHQHIWTDKVTGTIKSAYPDKPMLQQSSDEAKSYQLNFQANYEHSFGNHNLTGIFVVEQTENNRNSFYGGRETFPVSIVDQFFAASGARTDGWAGGSAAEGGRLSYIGQLGYNYNEKYFLNGSLRRDGSSIFPPSKRWGYFPTISGGWIVTKESFFDVPQINFLKLRASAALSGNDNVVGWQWLDTYSPSGNAYFGVPPSINPGIALDRITNPNITWEKSRDFNIGADMNFLKHWNLSADYWFKHTYDILGSRIQALPSSFGFSLPAENYAKIDAHGFDFEIGYDNKIGALNYFVKGSFSYGTNKVVQMDYPANAPEYGNPVGKPLGIITGYVSDKIIRTQADLDAVPAGFTVFGLKPELGMLIYKDLSGSDKKPDGKIDSYDQTLLSKRASPPVRYGLNLGSSWKSFSLELMFAGQAGNKKFPDGMNGWVEWNRVPSMWLDHWSPETPNASLPNPKSAFGPNTYNTTSDFWMKDGGFVRLKYLSAAYALPSQWMTKVGLSAVKLVFSGTNLFYLSKFKYFDPEIGSMGAYPNMKTYNFGLDVTF
jgi:TonB-linked SusC/RagA family outer membrane protein